jgi:hypothetical protein
MPQHVRNFWIEGRVDGRKEPIGAGPRAKDGGFYLTIRIRENGAISDKKLCISGGVGVTGDLYLLAQVYNDGHMVGDLVKVNTER